MSEKAPSLASDKPIFFWEREREENYFIVSNVHEPTLSLKHIIREDFFLNVSFFSYSHLCHVHGVHMSHTERKATRSPAAALFLVCHTFKELPGLANFEAAYFRDVGIGHNSMISIHLLHLCETDRFLLLRMRGTANHSEELILISDKSEWRGMFIRYPAINAIYNLSDQFVIRNPTALEGGFKFFQRGVCLYTICDLICLGRARSPGLLRGILQPFSTIGHDHTPYAQRRCCPMKSSLSMRTSLVGPSRSRKLRSIASESCGVLHQAEFWARVMNVFASTTRSAIEFLRGINEKHFSKRNKGCRTDVILAACLRSSWYI